MKNMSYQKISDRDTTIRRNIRHRLSLKSIRTSKRDLFFEVYRTNPCVHRVLPYINGPMGNKVRRTLYLVRVRIHSICYEFTPIIIRLTAILAFVVALMTSIWALGRPFGILLFCIYSLFVVYPLLGVCAEKCSNYCLISHGKCTYSSASPQQFCFMNTSPPLAN